MLPFDERVAIVALRFLAGTYLRLDVALRFLAGVHLRLDVALRFLGCSATVPQLEKGMYRYRMDVALPVLRNDNYE